MITRMRRVMFQLTTDPNSRRLLLLALALGIAVTGMPSGGGGGV